MMDKIIGALTFKSGVYSEAKNDSGFTATAWLIVVISAILNSIGTSAAVAHWRFGSWLLGALLGAVFAVVGFALACFVITWVGRTVFNTTASFEEVVRPLGLARIWHVVGVLGIFALLIPALGCITGIVNLAAAVLGFIAWLIAVREALALEWPQAIAVVVLGMIVVIIITAISGIILGALGLASAAFVGIFR